jgi:hypothetical protein
VIAVWPEGPENYEGWFVQYFVSVCPVSGASGADFSGTTVSGEIGYGMGWPVIGFIFCVCYYWRVAGGVSINGAWNGTCMGSDRR